MLLLWGGVGEGPSSWESWDKVGLDFGIWVWPGWDLYGSVGLCEGLWE